MRTCSRRSVLGLLGGAVLAACTKSSGSGSNEARTTSSGAPRTGEALTEIPAETAGPFPGDGSNGPNVLDDGGVVRRDITSSWGSMSGTAAGIPLAITLTVRDAAGGAPLPGAAVYLWQCDREGRYSLYSAGADDQNYLRGVQVADANGTLTFDSIFPGAYPGRWPHAHFEVYASEADAVGGAAPIATSQLALPQDACDAAYGTAGYEASARTMQDLSLATDGVFRDDGAVHQLATVTGDVGGGFAAVLVVGV